MPRTTVVKISEIVDIIVAHKDQVLSKTGSIVGPTNPVWENLSVSLGGKQSKKGLYTFVKCNRHNIHEQLQLTVNKVEAQTSSESKTSSESETSSESDEADIILSLSAEEWTQISPRDFLYQCNEKYKEHRLYQVLPQKIWTDIIQKKFSEETKLPCVLSFKRAKVNKAGLYYLQIHGACTDCAAQFRGVIEDTPEPNEKVIIKCSFVGNFKQPHSRSLKRNLSGPTKNDALFAMTVQNINPSLYRRLQADKLINFGDAEPVLLPSSNALRLAKSRHLKKNRLHDDPLASVLKMKYTSEYQHVIKDIGLAKLFIHYWSSSQMHIYRSYCEKTLYPTVSIDATGSLIKSLNRPFKNTSGAIFLYEITVKDKVTGNYSVSNMLSERHDNISIFHWLAQWIRDGAVPPKQVVCDQSVALLSACTRAFTDFSNLSDYIERCYELVNGSRAVPCPFCFIRCDVAHTVHQISKWSCLRGKDFRVRNLYLRSLAQIIQATNIDDVRSILGAIFIVALSPYEGCDAHSGEETACEKAKKKLKQLIAIAIRVDTEYLVNVENEAEDQSKKEDESKKNSFPEMATKIAKRCQDQVDMEEGDHDNLQFLPELVPYVINLCGNLPLWSGIMVPIFGYGSKTASTSSVENSFNDLKNRVFSQKKLPIRLDEFLQLHIQSTEGTMKIIAASHAPNTNEVEERKKEAHTPCSSDKTSTKQEETFQSANPDNLFHDTEENANLQTDNHTQNSVNTFTEKEPSLLCMACCNGDFPSGAHRCRFCKIAVHLLPGCSQELPGSGEEREGYGQQRVCTR